MNYFANKESYMLNKVLIVDDIKKKADPRPPIVIINVFLDKSFFQIKKLNIIKKNMCFLPEGTTKSQVQLWQDNGSNISQSKIKHPDTKDTFINSIGYSIEVARQSGIMPNIFPSPYSSGRAFMILESEKALKEREREESLNPVVKLLFINEKQECQPGTKKNVVPTNTNSLISPIKKTLNNLSVKQKRKINKKLEFTSNNNKLTTPIKKGRREESEYYRLADPFTFPTLDRKTMEVKINELKLELRVPFYYLNNLNRKYPGYKTAYFPIQLPDLSHLSRSEGTEEDNNSFEHPDTKALLMEKNKKNHVVKQNLNKGVKRNNKTSALLPANLGRNIGYNKNISPTRALAKTRNKKFEGSAERREPGQLARKNLLESNNLQKSPLFPLPLRKGSIKRKEQIEKARVGNILSHKSIVLLKKNIKISQGRKTNRQVGVSTALRVWQKKNMFKYKALCAHKFTPLTLRHLLHEYHLTSLTSSFFASGNYSAVVYNFLKLSKRLNTLDSLDYTGSRIKANVSMLLKYFFYSIGKMLISKPEYIFEHNKVTIQLAIFFNSNVFNSYKIKKKNQPGISLSSTKIKNIGRAPSEEEIGQNILYRMTEVSVNPLLNNINKAHLESPSNLGSETALSEIVSEPLWGALKSKKKEGFSFFRKKVGRSRNFYFKSRTLKRFLNRKHIERKELQKVYFYFKYLKKKRMERKIISLISVPAPDKKTISLINNTVRSHSVDQEGLIESTKDLSAISHPASRPSKNLQIKNFIAPRNQDLKIYSGQLKYNRKLNVISAIRAKLLNKGARSGSEKTKTTKILNANRRVGARTRNRTIPRSAHPLSFYKPSSHKFTNIFPRGVGDGEMLWINKNKKLMFFIKSKLNALTYLLEKFFKRSVHLELNRLKYPYSDSNILAQIMGLNGKISKFEYILMKVIKRAKIFNPRESLVEVNFTPEKSSSLVSRLSGIKIRLAGRFYKRKIIPRKTVFNLQRGSLARGIINYVDSSKYINKTKRGSFCLTISVSHAF